MRAFVGGAVALLLLWGIYLASPYWALRTFLVAVETGDARAIADRMNVRAVRLSLTKQIAADGLASKTLSAALGSPTPLSAGAIAAAADPLLEQIVTPEALATALPEVGAVGREAGGGRGRWPSVDRIATFLGASRWRGFRNVYFTLPPGAGPDRRVRLQFRLSRLSWRLVGIEPTPETRARLLADLVRLRRPGG